MMMLERSTILTGRARVGLRRNASSEIHHRFDYAGILDFVCFVMLWDGTNTAKGCYVYRTRILWNLSMQKVTAIFLWKFMLKSNVEQTSTSSPWNWIVCLWIASSICIVSRSRLYVSVIRSCVCEYVFVLSFKRVCLFWLRFHCVDRSGFSHFSHLSQFDVDLVQHYGHTPYRRNHLDWGLFEPLNRDQCLCLRKRLEWTTNNKS